VTGGHSSSNGNGERALPPRQRKECLTHCLAKDSMDAISPWAALR
jgi:hypothetical protein